MSPGGTWLQGKIRRTKYVQLGREMTKQGDGEMINVYKYLKGVYTEEAERFCSVSHTRWWDQEQRQRSKSEKEKHTSPKNLTKQKFK